MTAQPLPEKIYFVLPDDREKPSGGNIYNQYLIEALKHMGQEVVLCSFAQYQQVLSVQQSGIYGVDSLFVDTLKDQLPEKKPGGFSFFILHHLESLHPQRGESGHILFEKERKVLDTFDMILATSDFSRQYLRQKQVDIPVIVVEPALTESSTHTQPVAELPMRGLIVANVVERKGVFSFLQALQRNAKESDSFHLSIVGRKDMELAYYQACERLVQHSILREKVFFLGGLSHDETLRQYAHHHVLVSAASMETYGMALQEARTYGLPLLVLEGGNSSRHIRQGSGILCADIFELAGNFLQLSRSKTALQACLDAAQKQHEDASYRWEEAASIFLHQIRNFL